MRILFLFLDGIGLGINDPEINPFARVFMPVLENLLGGKKLVIDSVPYIDERTTLLQIDACLGTEGFPQSATGQTTLLTGINVPQKLGYHYGPKPNQEIKRIIQNENVFSKLIKAGRKVDFLNAYPPRYFDAIHSGRRIHSALPFAVTNAGIPLKTIDMLRRGDALSADFTSQGWRDNLNIQDIPIIQPQKAGERMALLSSKNDFTFFEYWLSDIAGHTQNMESACQLLDTLDLVIGGLLGIWNFSEGLILLSSDHGNMEDISTRRHTMNPVPLLIIGDLSIRQQFFSGLYSLSDIAPSILKFFNFTI